MGTEVFEELCCDQHFTECLDRRTGCQLQQLNCVLPEDTSDAVEV